MERARLRVGRRRSRICKGYLRGWDGGLYLVDRIIYGWVVYDTGFE